MHKRAKIDRYTFLLRKSNCSTYLSVPLALLKMSLGTFHPIDVPYMSIYTASMGSKKQKASGFCPNKFPMKEEPHRWQESTRTVVEQESKDVVTWKYLYMYIKHLYFSLADLDLYSNNLHLFLIASFSFTYIVGLIEMLTMLSRDHKKSSLPHSPAAPLSQTIRQIMISPTHTLSFQKTITYTEVKVHVIPCQNCYGPFNRPLPAYSIVLRPWVIYFFGWFPFPF